MSKIISKSSKKSCALDPIPAGFLIDFYLHCFLSFQRFLRKLLDHIASNNLREPLQSAYKCHHDTETVLLKVQSDLLFAVDDHKASVVVLFYLSAAFDTIYHTIFVNRLRNDYGL